MGRFAGKVAFITGAGREPGRRHAMRLAEEGADIIAVDTTGADTRAMSETVELLEMTGSHVVTAEADVHSPAALSAAVDKGVAALGRLDIVLVNAESAELPPALGMTEQPEQQLNDHDLAGVWQTIKAATPPVIRSGRGGAVVITSSLASLVPEAAWRPRGTVKTGLITLLKTLADELEPSGIRVNAVHHATTAADLIFEEATCLLVDAARAVRGTAPAAQAATLTRMPVATLDPDDVTNAVLYLASDDGCYVTGTMHVVDACGAG